MAEPSVPYWTIRHLESGESVPGQTFTVFIAEGDGEDARYFDLQRMIEEPGQQEMDLELDSYCIVSEGDGVDFGGLEEATLLPGRLHPPVPERVGGGVATAVHGHSSRDRAGRGHR